MAGDWIKVEHTLPDKPEVVAMASMLKIDQDAVTGKLLRVWIWADQNSVDGNGLSVTDSFLDRVTACPGFAAAMRAAGWLTGADGALCFPDFTRNNGQTAKARAVTNRRVAEHRSRGNADVTPGALQKPLPEKRREEVLQSVSRASESGEVEGRPGEVPTLKQWVAECARYQVPAWYAAEKHAAFEAKGWMSGKTPLVWRSVVKNWVVRDHHNDGRPQNPPPVGAGRPNGSAPRVSTSTKPKNGF